MNLNWRRPHPFTLLAEFAQAVGQTILPLFLVLTNRGGQDESGDIIDQFGELLFFAVPLILAGARWYSTRYAVDDEAVYLNSGIFKRTKQVLPRANIQNLSTAAPLMARVTNLVQLTISDASADGDVKLRFIDQPEADRLTRLLRDSVVPPPTSAGVPLGPPGLAPPTLAPPTAPAQALWEDSTPAVSTTTSELFKSSVAINGLALILLPIAILNIIGRLITLGGYRVWDDPDRIRIKTGLVTEHQIAARRERIQLIRVNRAWLMRKFGMEEVKYSTADIEGPVAYTSFLNPAARHNDWPKLAQMVLPAIELSEADLVQVSPLTQRRIFVRFIVGALLFVAVVAAVAWNYEPRVMPFLPIALIAIVAFGYWYSKARFANLGYAVGQTQMLGRNGVIDHQLTLVRLNKVQGVTVSATFFQKRLGLASLSLGTAGHGGSLGKLTIPDLSAEDAKTLASRLASFSATTALKDTL